MKPEDRARLEVLRGSMYGDVLTLVRIIDEQAAEIAKLAGEADAEFYRGRRNAVENPDGPIALMLESLTAQLAEECVKREAAEEVCETLKSRHAIVKERADKAERELAEMRQILLDERVQATKGAWAASEMQKRVEGLQALVDAATEFRFGRFRVLPQYIAERGYLVEDQYGDWLVFDIPKHEAIALARDLAAKEKEPK